MNTTQVEGDQARREFPAIELPPERARRLRIGNLVVGLLHLAQVAALLALSTDFVLPVTETFPSGPPGTAPPQPQALFDLPLGFAVAAFVGLAALDHLLVGGPASRWYAARLRAGINPARWVEYSVSASLMVVLIAMLSGIVDVTALTALFGANVAMILFGVRMERVNDQTSGRVDWEPFVHGCIAGLFPWIAILISVTGAEAESGQVPGFVFAIIVSLFLFFMSFAVNQWLQYRRVGPWRDYVFGEWAYLVLSLGAKSALAWQVFANVLIES